MASKSKSFDFTKVDLYDLLDLAPDADEKQVIKAYRKKALKYHPDKNPDPSAVEIFHKLSKALEVLTDAAAKAAYDKVLKGRKAAEQRHKVLDAKRQKLKSDLEAREAAGVSSQQRKAQEARNLEMEIERLRKEGSSLLEREQQLMREELAKQATALNQKLNSSTTVDASPRLKLKWKVSKSDLSTTAAYTSESLTKLFSKYGKVSTVLISSKKKGSAILEFEATTDQLILVDQEFGLSVCPLTVTWLSGKPSQSQEFHEEQLSYTQPNEASISSERDFEDVVMMKMRQAEERKRIIEQMQKEDEADT